MAASSRNASLPQVSGTDFVTQWINSHEQVALAAGKPLIVEEFGKVGQRFH